MRAWISVSDASVAVQWGQVDADDGKYDLNERFALRQRALAGAHVPMARCELFGPAGRTELLAVFLSSPDEARKLAAELLPSGPTHGPDGSMLRRAPELDASSGDLARVASCVVDSTLLISDAPSSFAELVRNWLTLRASGGNPGGLDKGEEQLQTLTATADSDGVRLDIAWEVLPGQYWQRSPDATAFARRHGLDAVAAVRGVARFSDRRLTAAVTRIELSSQPASSLALLRLAPADNLSLPTWLDAAGHGGTLLSIGLPEAMDHIAAFFDDAFAEGIAGTYEEVLEDIRSPEGLELDLQRQLYAHLGDHVFLAGSDPPDREASSRWDFRQQLLALAIREGSESEVAAAVRAMMEDDPEVRRERIEGQPNPLWIYPADADSWGGVAVFAGYLCLCPDVSQLRQAMIAEAAAPAAPLQTRDYRAPAELTDTHGPFSVGPLGGILVPARRTREVSDAHLLRNFVAGFPGDGESDEAESEQRPIWGDFVPSNRRHEGWCFFSDSGWLVVTRESLSSEASPPAKSAPGADFHRADSVGDNVP